MGLFSLCAATLDPTHNEVMCGVDINCQIYYIYFSVRSKCFVINKIEVAMPDIMKCEECHKQGHSHGFIDVETSEQKCPDCGSTFVVLVPTVEELLPDTRRRRKRTAKSFPPTSFFW